LSLTSPPPDFDGWAQRSFTSLGGENVASRMFKFPPESYLFSRPYQRCIFLLPRCPPRPHQNLACFRRPSPSRIKSYHIPIDAYQRRNRATPCPQPADCCPFSIKPVSNAFNRGRCSFNTVLSVVELVVYRQTPAPPSLPTPITVSYVVYPFLCTTSSSKKMDTSDPF